MSEPHPERSPALPFSKSDAILRLKTKGNVVKATQKQSQTKSDQKLSEFSKKVIREIRKIPKGRIASYSQIAKLVGHPNSTRAVVWILHACGEKYNLPWHRVLNAKGKIGFRIGTLHYQRQKRLLMNEGVKFNDNDLIDLTKFRWSKKPRALRGHKKTPQMFS